MFELNKLNRQSVKTDLLSGLTVAFALVPEAVAFAFVAGVDPLVGLYAAFMVGLVTSVFGGRPGMISGATGAMAVVMVALVTVHGVQYLFAAVLLAGFFQILFGALHCGKFIRMVPHSVMIGFVNGLAIVIFLAQLGQFKIKDATGKLIWLTGAPLYTMLGLILLTMVIIHFLPKLTTVVPSTLVAITVITLLVYFIPSLDVRTVVDYLQSMTGDANATIAGGLPRFALPAVPFNLKTLIIIFPYSAILAAVGLIESLLTLTLVDEMTGTRGRANKECVAQGAANMINGVFGGMGGCAMIGQSMININSGGRGRISGITAAIVLLAFILFASDLIEMVPLAALVGVMFIVVLGTFEWASFKMMRRVPKKDAFVIVLVTVVTVMADLALAVIVGVIVSALIFAWEHASHINSVSSFNAEKNEKSYQINGPLFFGSVTRFLELFNVKEDPHHVIIDFAASRVLDQSAIEAISTLSDRYIREGKKLHVRHLSQDCRKLLHKAGVLVEMNLIEDPSYRVASDLLG
ncbi:MAG: SulP family inorganic anion transporter [Psychromonas sp.]|nr:SulP family inorganic anion transporter [Psychromonas sp.]